MTTEESELKTKKPLKLGSSKNSKSQYRTCTASKISALEEQCNIIKLFATIVANLKEIFFEILLLGGQSLACKRTTGAVIVIGTQRCTVIE
jgi:hypothetical protein